MVKWGRTPLQIIIIKKILKYNFYLNSKDDNTLVKQFLYISQELGKKYTNSYSYLLLDTLNFYSSQRFRKPDSIIEFYFHTNLQIQRILGRKRLKVRLN